MKKKLITTVITISLATAMSMTSFAGYWKKDNQGWWWRNDGGSYPANTWEWLDGNKDGIAECYYFDASGYLLTNTTTPDHYTVDENGAWIKNGIVQTKTVPVVPDFVSNGYVCDMQIDVEYPYTTVCYENNHYITTGAVMLNDYQTIISDSTHEEKDGYEWKIVTFQFEFTDDNAWNYGYLFGTFNTNYYNVNIPLELVKEDKSGNLYKQTVEYNGTKTEIYSRSYSDTFWVDNHYAVGIMVQEFLVPIGYDGIVVGVQIPDSYTADATSFTPEMAERFCNPNSTDASPLFQLK